MTLKTAHWLTLATVGMALASASVEAGEFKTLFAFPGDARGTNPYTRPVVDRDGAVYGVSPFGGSAGYGVVWRLAPPTAAGGKWTMSTIYTFKGGADGRYPIGPVRFGPGGKLYGTAANGGNSGAGVVFTLNPSADRRTWSYAGLHQFAPDREGGYPDVALSFDTRNQIYGVTPTGGRYGYGTVFHMAPSGANFQVLHDFADGRDGRQPHSRVAIDRAGNVYGTTRSGGLKNDGVVYALSAAANWKASIIYNFSFYSQGAESATEGGVTIDPVTQKIFLVDRDWQSQNRSAVVELVRPGSGSTTWTRRVLTYGPYGPYMDINSGLAKVGTNTFYGLSSSGGTGYAGEIWKLQFNAARTAVTATVVHNFTEAQLSNQPEASLTLAPDGTLVGVDRFGGRLGYGSVFSWRP